MNEEQQNELFRFWDRLTDAKNDIERAVEEWNEGKAELEEKFEEVETLRDEVNDTITTQCSEGASQLEDLASFLESMDGGPSDCDPEDQIEPKSILGKLVRLKSELSDDCGFEEYPAVMAHDALSLEIPGELENDYDSLGVALAILEDLKDVGLEPPVTLESLKVEVTELRGLYEEIQSAIKRIKEEEG